MIETQLSELKIKCLQHLTIIITLNLASLRSTDAALIS